MGLLWPDLSASVGRVIVNSIVRLDTEMNAVDIAVLLWSLAVLEVPLDIMGGPLVESLLSAVRTRLPDMKSQEIAKTIWGLSSCGLTWDGLPTDLKWWVNAHLCVNVNVAVNEFVVMSFA